VEEATMPDDLVNVYEAENLMDAELISGRLEEAGIKAYVDNTDGPLAGLTAANQVQVVRVLPQDRDKAAKIVKEFEEEAALGMPTEEDL